MQFSIPTENLDTQNPLLIFHQMCFGYLYNDWLMVISGIFILSQLLLLQTYKGINRLALMGGNLYLAYLWYVRLFRNTRYTPSYLSS